MVEIDDHDLTCGICLTDIPDTYMECFHKVCSTCVKSLDKCPICRYDFSRDFVCSVKHPICAKNKLLKSQSSSRVDISEDNRINYMINDIIIESINRGIPINRYDINNSNLLIR